MGDRLFAAQFVVAEENQWFAPDTSGPAIRSERRHHIAGQLFTATDEEDAYRKAIEWVPGFSDSNHDGPGDLTQIFAVGLHQLEELIPGAGELIAALRQPYGADIGTFDPLDVDDAGVPRVRSRDELEVFRRPGAVNRMG